MATARKPTPPEDLKEASRENRHIRKEEEHEEKPQLVKVRRDQLNNEIRSDIEEPQSNGAVRDDKLKAES